nr:YbaK/EbsC family protein [Microthrixaceae bacterium]
MHRNVETVIAAAGEKGLAIEPRPFPEGTKTAQDAAAAIGVEVGQIVKSLVFLVDGAPVMALVPGDRRLDESLLAEAVGGSVVERPDA